MIGGNERESLAQIISRGEIGAKDGQKPGEMNAIFSVPLHITCCLFMCSEFAFLPYPLLLSLLTNTSKNALPQFLKVARPGSVLDFAAFRS